MVHKVSASEGDSLVDVLRSASVPWSENNSVVVSMIVAVLVGKSVVSSLESSDGLSSGIIEEPLVVIEWRVVHHSNSVLVSSNVFLDRESSSTRHS